MPDITFSDLGVSRDYLITIVLLGSIVFVAFSAQLFYLAHIRERLREQSQKGGYFRLTQGGRAKIKAAVRFQRRLLSPMIWAKATFWPSGLMKHSIRYQGFRLPGVACSRDSLLRAVEYRPMASELYVASYMQSGASWMQHIALQVLTRGQCNLAESGIAISGVSPWLESDITSEPGSGPFVGEETPARIIKTHLPVYACPINTAAKYIYVVRHPLTCFEACAHAVTYCDARKPAWRSAARWFDSDKRVWWGNWASHVKGWGDLAESEENVLFVRFEDLELDFDKVVSEIAEFLEISPFSQYEMTRIRHKCGLRHSRNNWDCFERLPPQLMPSAADKLRSFDGSLVPKSIASQITSKALHQLAGDASIAKMCHYDLLPPRMQPHLVDTVLIGEK